MKRSAKLISLAILAAAALYGGVSGYLASKSVSRDGTLALANLTAPVEVRYDEFGVPHISAQNEADLYRALGYVAAQDRLFQMEMSRRLARGELAEVVGEELVETDRLFRVLGIRQWADEHARDIDMNSPATKALIAYLDGVNQFQDTQPAPLEFDLLGIPKRPFTISDTLSTTGYLAFSFASAFKTEPVMTYIRDQLGHDYLKPFDLGWHPQGVVASQATSKSAALNATTWQSLTHLATLSSTAIAAAGMPQMQGSNAWAISGKRTASGKPILAGDPHIAFATPAIWYEAHLSAPGFELYGHHPALVPTALLGLNKQFAWSLTMFQNDDIDLIKEKINPANARQAWSGDPKTGQWVDIETRSETIAVKGKAPVSITLQRGPHGPIINDVFPTLHDTAGDSSKQPIAMWWALYAADAPLLDAMYQMNRADTLDKARTAASLIHAPGLNVIWANASGDIGWWAAAKLPVRPTGVSPRFILDAGKGEAEKLGWYPFAKNPQEENPPRGYIVSANHQPAPASGIEIPGYYAMPDRAKRLDEQLIVADTRWAMATTQALQVDNRNGYGPRLLALALPILRQRVTAADELALLDLLEKWDGAHELDRVAPTVFNQMLYEIPHAAMADELGNELFMAALRVSGMDNAIPRLVADADSVWWDDTRTAGKETRSDTLLAAWNTTLSELRRLFGNDPKHWTWDRAHTLTNGHPLGMKKPLDRIFNVGPFPAPGGHETPNNYSNPIGPLPLAVTFGPSTRRVIDFAAPEKSMGINPVGQSGVRLDAHYADQALMHMAGRYRQHYLSDEDVRAHTRHTLHFQPK